ncbi:MAG: branched-chain amino acid ABC transporter permease [Alphaproteobacteria bacterium]|jgi:branched-chain amino acid transport system permease protein|nr:branched-chain amino acid ABC transporter permease [Alphaproteobacteria bacterium]
MARTLLVVVLALLLFAALATLPLFLKAFYIRVGLSIFLSAGFAVCWWLLAGFTAYYSFGHTAFVGVGAFAAALTLRAVAAAAPGLQLAAGLLAGLVTAAVIAAAIAWPILRLRGHYFTIAMLAVALVLGEAVSAFPVFGGSAGLSLPNIAPSGMRVEAFFYWLALALLAIVMAIAWIISRSRLGYGLAAIREDEDAAQMLGVPTTRFKVVAFVLSGGLTGALGAVYALNLGYITTDSVFRGSLSLEMIVNSLVGGMGSLLGPVIGAAIMTGVTKLVLADLLEYHLAITGLLIVAVVLVAPDGVAGLWRRTRR